MGRLEEQDFDEKRLARRQRRKKSQLFAFIILISVVVVIAAVCAFGVHTVSKYLGEKKVQDEEAAAIASSEYENNVIETPEEVTEPVEMSESDVLEEIVNGCVSELSLEDKVAGLFMVTPEQLTGVPTVVKAGSSTQDALSKYSVGGIVYSAKNIKSQDQITEMIKSTQDMSKYPIFTALREDGSSEGAISSSVGGIDAVEINSSDSAYITGTSIAANMFKYGFNFDIAPEIDLSENSRYGNDVTAVSDIVSSFTNSLGDSGVFSCLYAFPAKVEGTSSAMAASEMTKEELASGNFSVYKNAISSGKVSAVMMSNGSFPGYIGDNTPASLSNIAIDELRSNMGYEGVIVTGPLDEGAITQYYTSAEAAVDAIAAGADIIYLPENFEEAYQGVLDAVSSGKITEERIDESIKRIYRLKYSDKINEIK